MDDVFLTVAQIVPYTEAEYRGGVSPCGCKGVRWRCPGCCNPEMLPFAGGVRVSVAEVLGRINGTNPRHRGRHLAGGRAARAHGRGVGAGPRCGNAD